LLVAVDISAIQFLRVDSPRFHSSPFFGGDPIKDQNIAIYTSLEYPKEYQSRSNSYGNSEVDPLLRMGCGLGWSKTLLGDINAEDYLRLDEKHD